MIIELFYAYQFCSPHISKIEREHAVERAVEAVTAEFKASRSDLRITWNFLDLETLKPVFSQIDAAIQRSAIFAADLSDFNANVMFELGVSYGLSKFLAKSFVALCHDSISITDLPSDFHGMFVERYSASNFQRVFAHSLKKAIETHLAQLDLVEKEHYGLASVWRYCGQEEIDLVCSQIPAHQLPHFADPRDRNFLRYAKFADLDSLVHLKVSLSKMFPNLRLKDFTSEEHRTADYGGMIIIGGPAWNHRFRAFQNLLPISFIERPEDQDDSLVIREEFGIPHREMMPIFDSKGAVVRDVSVICRLTDVHGRTIFIFAGCLTLGVLGAARALLGRNIGLKNSKYVHSKFGENDFVITFYSDHIEHESMPRLFDVHRPICSFQRRANSGGVFSLVEENLAHYNLILD